MNQKPWIIEKRKRGAEIYVTNRQTDAIFIGEGYEDKEYKRSMELAKVITKALNDYEHTLVICDKNIKDIK